MSLALVMLVTACGSDKKMNAAVAPEAAITGTQGESPTDELANRAPAVDPGLDGDEPEGGGEFEMDGFSIQQLISETTALMLREVRDYEDPVTHETFPIVDDAVIVWLVNAPELPDEDGNYFDTQKYSSDPCYSSTYPAIIGDEDVDDFIEAENLDVYSEWLPFGAFAANLPEGTSVEDAVDDWPTGYSELIDEVSPVLLCDLDAFPQSDPNDDYWSSMWNLDEDSAYDINILGGKGDSHDQAFVL
ncbi:MAG: hypothetical protein HRF49_03375 [bacterium]